MIKILNKSEIQCLDKSTREETGISSFILMENAGRLVAEFLLKEFSDSINFVIVAGVGNNGGDGLVVARTLFQLGKLVRVFILADVRDKRTTEFEYNFNICNNLCLDIIFLNEHNYSTYLETISKDTICVDAIFGVGIRRPISGFISRFVKKINSLESTIVSIDMPSGLFADDGEILGECIKANITLSIDSPKLCHLIYPAREYCGKVFTLDISLDSKYKESVKRQLLSPYFLTIPSRSVSSHKYNNGNCLLVGGSVGMHGAIIMASKGAISTGSGLVTAMIPASIIEHCSANMIQEMLIPLPLNNECFDVDTSILFDKILSYKKYTGIVIGPGMRVNEGAKSLLIKVIDADTPLVIDADGLNNLLSIENWTAILKSRKAVTVLTPHSGEAGKLLGVSAIEIEKDLERYALELARKTSSFIVLKSSITVIACPNENVYYSIYGNAGMAKAGSGDILAGIIGSLMPRLEYMEAIKLAVYIHGRAGDLAKSKLGVEAMLATDIIDNITLVYNELANHPTPKALINAIRFI